MRAEIELRERLSRRHGTPARLLPALPALRLPFHPQLLGLPGSPSLHLGRPRPQKTLRGLGWGLCQPDEALLQGKDSSKRHEGGQSHQYSDSIDGEGFPLAAWPCEVTSASGLIYCAEVLLRSDGAALRPGMSWYRAHVKGWAGRPDAVSSLAWGPYQPPESPEPSRGSACPVRTVSSRFQSTLK